MGLVHITSRTRPFSADHDRLRYDAGHICSVWAFSSQWPTTSACGELSYSSRKACRALRHLYSFSIMAPAARKPSGQVVQAEVALQQTLKNCLVNLPASLVSVLVNANAVCINWGSLRGMLIAVYRSRRMLLSSFPIGNLLHPASPIPRAPRRRSLYMWDGLACKASASWHP